MIKKDGGKGEGFLVFFPQKLLQSFNVHILAFLKNMPIHYLHVLFGWTCMEILSLVLSDWCIAEP